MSNRQGQAAKADAPACADHFDPPPFDGSLLFPEWIDWHLQKNPDHVYASLVSLGDEETVDVTWAEVAHAVLRLASKLRHDVCGQGAEAAGRVAVAVLADVDSLTYCTIVMAIVRAGFVAFPISTRNSVPALEHLIRSTSCAYMLGSLAPAEIAPSALQETTVALLDLVPTLHLLDVPAYSDLYPRLAKLPVHPYDPELDALHTPHLPSVRSFPDYANITNQDTIFYLHSSGSTNFPKPIPFSHRHWIGECRDAVTGGFDMLGSRWAVMGLPPFHGMGVCLMLGAAAAGGSISLMFRPSTEPILPTSENIISACQKGKADYLLAVPSSCIEWARDKEALRYLATMEGVLYGGGPLPQEIGDQLVAAGVKLAIEYGSTEAGLLFKLGMQGYQPQNWNYGELYPNMQVELVPQEGGLFRLIIIYSDGHPIAVSNQQGVNAFDTSDLFEEHPTRKGMWKIVGRADDEIVMLNGEKTNPGPIENIIAGNLHVQACVLFGHGRQQVGIAVEPVKRIDLANIGEVDHFRDLIWSDVEKANAIASGHSRIFKEMILVIDPADKPFLKTPKGTISRNVTLTAYSAEIDAFYNAAAKAEQSEWVVPPSTWNRSAIHTFVARLVNGVLRGRANPVAPIDEERNLFDQGCDSLHTVYIRAGIVAALRQAPVFRTGNSISIASLPQTVVYHHPTVLRLVSYMEAMAMEAMTEPEGGPHIRPDPKPEIIDEMHAMVDKYTSDFPTLEPGLVPQSKEVVLLTGSTGALGTYLLEQLLLDPAVERVYAFNRAGCQTLASRQRAAFAHRGVDAKLLESPKLRLIDVNVTGGSLDLCDELLQEIRGSLTTVIHNAWLMDFNLELAAFEGMLRWSRWLIDLALIVKRSTPARFLFTSTVAIASNWSEPRAVPESSFPDPALAVANGYSESKWVMEEILRSAADQRGLPATIMRLGQMCGSTRNGAWNANGWFPMLVKSGERIGMLPSLPGRVSWVPVDQAASAIVDVMHQESTQERPICDYIHVVHPHPATWNRLVAPMAQRLRSALVPFSVWFKKLEETAEDSIELEHNPAIKLLEFYRTIPPNVLQRAGASDSSRLDVGKEAINLPDFESVQALRRSESLRNLKPLRAQAADGWFEYWTRRGFIAYKSNHLAQ